MNKLFSAVFAFSLFATSIVCAETITPQSIIIKGEIICNKCAAANKDNLAEFIKGHPKMCMTHAGCVASGYSLYSNGKLEKFSKDSEKQISEYLAKDESKTSVEVTANKNNGELSLISMKTQ